jgi:hypothetical protein
MHQIFKKKNNNSDELKKREENILESINNLERNCTLSSSNCGNIANKLTKRKNFFQILLPYYSIIGIINGLIPRFFSPISKEKLDLLGFWGIIVSISFLVISMLISLAKYPERIERATYNLNNLKILKNNLQTAKNDLNEDEIRDYWQQYNNIIQNYSLVNRRYFYKTCKHQDKHTIVKKTRRAKKNEMFFKYFKREISFQEYIKQRNNISVYSELDTHFSFIEKLSYELLNFLETISYITVLILPFLVYIYIFVF